MVEQNQPMPWVCPECGVGALVPTICGVDRSAFMHRAGDSLLGSFVGRFRLARRLGEGATGVVYLAVHHGIRSQVAIKVLHKEVCRDEVLVQRFELAARATNKVSSDGVAKVLDIGVTSDGRPAAIMEYASGGSLSDHFETNGALSPYAAGRIIAQLLRALAAVHRAGVIHRDIKPANIQLTEGGYPILLDFGLALLAASSPQKWKRTRTGALLGSPHYLSPELARGDPPSIATDIYSTGAVLFEALTGSPPYVAKNLYELLRSHVADPVPVPSSLDERLAVWDSLLERALAKEPADRYVDADEMRAAVEDAAGIKRRKHQPTGI